MKHKTPEVQDTTNPEMSKPEQPSLPTPHRRMKARLLAVTVLAIGIPLLVLGIKNKTLLPPEAAPRPLTNIHIQPEIIQVNLGDPTVYLSALAYDSGGSPIWKGIRYQWGISTTESIGTLGINPGNDKIAGFTPSMTTKGQGDLWVSAYDMTGTHYTKSIPVYVGVTPSPAPSPSPTPTPIPSITIRPTVKTTPTLYPTPPACKDYSCKNIRNGKYWMIINCNTSNPNGDQQLCNRAGLVGICRGKPYCCPRPGALWTTNMSACKTPTPTPTPHLNTPPVILTTKLPNGVLRQPYNATIMAVDNERDQLNMSVTGLPTGILMGPCAFSFDNGKNQSQINCALSGKPSQMGIYSVGVTVTDSKKAVVKQSYRIYIFPFRLPPIF